MFISKLTQFDFFIRGLNKPGLNSVAHIQGTVKRRYNQEIYGSLTALFHTDLKLFSLPYSEHKADSVQGWSFILWSSKSPKITWVVLLCLDITKRERHAFKKGPHLFFLLYNFFLICQGKRGLGLEEYLVCRQGSHWFLIIFFLKMEN